MSTAAGAAPSLLRTRAWRLAASRLDAFFLFVVLNMAAHEAEHVGQVVQKRALDNVCPTDCRGLLGFAFDLEWVHVAYNHSLLVLLVAVYAGYRMWRPRWRERDRTGWVLMTAGVFVIQGYHVVEHTVKLDQWFANGHRSPTPGLLGQVLPLIELHFAINTVVFACVVAAYFRFGLATRPIVPAAAVAVLLLVPLAGAWLTRTPTIGLAAGVHQGPLVFDRTVKVVGEPGAVVHGGIRITADGVRVRDLAIVGGEHGVEIDEADGVVLDGVTVRSATLDGINARRSSVVVRDCRVESRAGAQGIDISFSAAREPSVVERCSVAGGLEGIVTHLAHAVVRDNRVTGTHLRAIAMTEMSMGKVEENDVHGALGVAIFCGDYSHCEIERNDVSGTRPDGSGMRTRMGYAIQAHYGAKATVSENRLARNAHGVESFLNATIRHLE